jgi:hypothetical protein
MLMSFLQQNPDKGRRRPAWNWGRVGGKGRGGEQGGEMTQTVYAHVNKWTKNKEKKGEREKKKRVTALVVFI